MLWIDPVIIHLSDDARYRAMGADCDEYGSGATGDCTPQGNLPGGGCDSPGNSAGGDLGCFSPGNLPV